MKPVSVFLIVCALACFLHASDARVLGALSLASLKQNKPGSRPRPNIPARPPPPRAYNVLDRDHGPPPPVHSNSYHKYVFWSPGLTAAGQDEGRTYG
ncbi:hypothetical protein PGTUg99_029576 [Puccinia graminis f. sp. tritici]|uniref:Uncharacterized protein n=1 Tax=Puccinia graminis f. sp. tritici TaxID=56615 RepID=A0A5B0P3I3_PUCGR|nr:hypothetical protein PGTUg99_029576 [Puccinia graminis f. sp. tritici]